jgi:hypothetical protein
MFTTIGSGMAPAGAALSADKILEYMATDELAGTATVKVTCVP